jgi:superfamily II DNA or RNA helicase
LTSRNSTGLAGIGGVSPLYFLPEEPFGDQVLIPAFSAAEQADCMIGFFASASLASIAPGLATYLNRATTALRLLISPFLNEQDQAALRNGTRSPDDAANEALLRMVVTEDALQRHTLQCLAYLLRTQRITIRIAVMKTALFHPKVWLFHASGHTLAAHGSSNMTEAGLSRNYEQVQVVRSWMDETQRTSAAKLCGTFDRLWGGKDESCHVLSLPQAVREQILRDFPTGRAPTEDECREIYGQAHQAGDVITDSSRRAVFSVPTSLNYEEGAYRHQGEAVASWCRANYRGILAMATGSGKTITSLICAHRLYTARQPLLIVIAAPYVPLLNQWCDEVALFGLRPHRMDQAGGETGRVRLLTRLRRRLSSHTSDVEVIVVSHMTLCTPAFAESMASFGHACMLIADEVHNLGRLGFRTHQPDAVQYRLGLSATPERQYDDEGTEALKAFFGDVVYEYPLQKAVGNCLVEYDYHVHLVALSEEEMDRYRALSERIAQNAWRADDGETDDYLAKLLRDRRALLETAGGKIEALRLAVSAIDARDIRHTLIYTSDKGPEQLIEVNAMLGKLGVLYRQLTAKETAHRQKSRQIIRAFQDGDIQVITAKRVLDEGVNIPEVCCAYILASTTVERQWIQRRGRLLRTCRALGKTHSVIHDFVAVPPSLAEGLDKEERMLVRSELRRLRRFAGLARNVADPTGPMAVIDELEAAVY